MLKSTGSVPKSSSFIATGAALCLGIVTGVQAGSPGTVNFHEKGVETHPSQGHVKIIEGAKATLLRTDTGVFASLATRELTPGHAYTLWWIIINEPAACEASPCKPADVLKRSKVTRADVTYADGLIAGEDRAGRFASYLPVGAIEKGWFGNGFNNPLRAEIHLVVTDHGPLLADLAQSMLGSARGGCTDESVPAAFPATAKADGAPGPNACRMVQDVIFGQHEGQSAKAR